MALGDAYKPSGAVKNSDSENREHEPQLWAKRIIEIPSDQVQRFEYNADGTVKYAAYGPRGLGAGDTGWLIHKFTYSSGAVTLRESAYDSWDNRVTASYS